ncbi:hypothetical protein [Fibrella forsythiae]|uniref:Uncharacterized protein n=1 Tax=Fibrella forsythiae TaxID=2817061 RepID=A0ABS3JMH7_9BACT|nr:hypothetical protein [Fibrella forsythiae]MBO0951199.1 hypothetical protein [Fibrella forsythiae]
MATIIKSGEKLYAKRDGINVYQYPRPDAARWMFRPQRDEPDGPVREYKMYDEIGIFHEEVDGVDGKYLKVEAWTNAEGFFGDNYTVAYFVYLKPSEDNALTQDQVKNQQEEARNQETISLLKSQIYPEWTALGITLPIDAFYVTNLDGKAVLMLKWANGYSIEYDKFKVLNVDSKKLGANAKVPVASLEDEDKDDSGTGSGDADTKGSTKSYNIYALLAGLGLFALVGTYIFIFKSRRHEH